MAKEAMMWGKEYATGLTYPRLNVIALTSCGLVAIAIVQ